MPQSPEPGRRLKRLLPLGALVVLASCNSPLGAAFGASKVDVVTLSTDILFGVPSPAPATVRQAAAPALPQQPQQSLALPDQPPSVLFTGNSFKFPVGAAPAACPTAPSTSFPADIATSEVKTMPATGSYRWATGGAYERTIGTQTVPLPLPAFEQRIVRHARTAPDNVPAQPGAQPDYVFTYETIEPRVADGTALLLSWQVKANANSVSQSGVSASDPEGGLVLKKVQVLDKNGQPAGTIFSPPSTGLLMMPLPAQPGTAINSTAVDSSGNSLRIKGMVGNRERVDACGEPIQAWGVDATVTNAGTGASATPTVLHYDVATQFGAVMVAFNIASGNWLGTTYKNETARVGQVKGDPVLDPYK